MKNLDYARSKIPPNAVAQLIGEQGCDECLAKEYCEETHPFGNSPAGCGKTIREWLKMERNPKDEQESG